jgi:hypothetical protein
MVTFNKDFKYDLEFGEIREQRVADILLNQKIEVKTERGQWATTGNIAIEYEYRGQPSGITTTEAPYWMHILEVDGEEFCTLLFKTSVLRTLLKTVKSSRRVAGGDDKQSKLVLLPLSELFKAAKKEF